MTTYDVAACKVRERTLGWVVAGSMYISFVRFRSFFFVCCVLFFFFNDTATTEIYTLSLHDALPI